MLKLVPFHPTWINHDKIDVHAIYRRPHRVEDEYGEMMQKIDAEGIPMWDLTGPLPVKQHTRWSAKGYEYVTLADRDSLNTAGMFGTVENYRQYDQHRSGGPWNYRLYAEGMKASSTIEADQLRDDVEMFGSEAVETLRKRTDLHFKLPPHLQGIPPGGKVGKSEKPKDEKATA